MPRTLKVEDLKQQLQSQQQSQMVSQISQIPQTEKNNQTRRRMLGPESMLEENYTTQTFSAPKSVSRIRIAILIGVAVGAQFFMNTRMFKSYLAKYITSPNTAMFVTVVIFGIIIIGSYFLLVN